MQLPRNQGVSCGATRLQVREPVKYPETMSPLFASFLQVSLLLSK